MSNARSQSSKLLCYSPQLYVSDADGGAAPTKQTTVGTHLGFMSQMPTEERQHQRSSFCNYGRPAYVPKLKAGLTPKKRPICDCIACLCTQNDKLTKLINHATSVSTPYVLMSTMESQCQVIWTTTTRSKTSSKPLHRPYTHWPFCTRL